MDWLRALGAAGIGAVQIREKDLEDRALYDLARRARETVPPATRVLVNGRLDIALAAGADGAHLPADGLPAPPLRARFGPDVLLGRSTHSVEDVERARDEGVDYVAFGPVYAAPGKGEPLGLAALARAARVGVAVFALGGVTLERFGELAATGAAGVAAIRLFQHPAELILVASAAREHFGRT
jgi:thiamine-phosphate pyrophosphorylase